MHIFKNGSLRITLISLIFVVLPGCKWPVWHRRTISSHQERLFFVEVLRDHRGTNLVKARPRIVIFSSCGGGGQASAAQAISDYLGDAYHIEVVHIFSEVLGGFDPLRFVSRNYVSGEDLYNYFLKHGVMWGGGMLGCCAEWIMGGVFCPYFAQRIENFLQKHNPDAIISVVPFINGAIQRAALQLDIPFTIIAPDLYTSHYGVGIDLSLDPNFVYNIPFEDAMIRKVIVPAQIKPEKVRIIGFPIRPAFLKRKEKYALRRKWHIPSDRPVIMVLMGAAGSNAALAYARKLIKVKLPHHVIFCLGRNTELFAKMKRMVFPPHMSVSFFGFTPNISDLMMASDILITKSGSVSVCEAIYAGIPLLLDCTSSLMYWEKMNIDFVEKYHFGKSITSLRSVPVIVEELLEHTEQLEEMRSAIEHFPLPDVCSNVQELVHNMVHHHDALLSDMTVSQTEELVSHDK